MIISIGEVLVLLSVFSPTDGFASAIVMESPQHVDARTCNV